MTAYALGLILLYNCGDAFRDALLWNAINVSRSQYLEVPRFPRWTRKQWLWHVVKWLTTYPLQLFVLISAGFSLIEIAVIAVAAFFVWQITYRLILK